MSQLIKQIKPVLEEKISPIIELFYKIGISPNFLTITGLILIIAGSYFLAVQNFIVAGILLTLGNICDALDGALARRFNQTSRFGAFLDSVIDRLSDAFPLMAIVYIFRNDDILLGISLVAIVFSFLVSYTRARAEGLGIECKVGFFERPERSIILIVSVFLSRVDIGIILIAIGAVITSLQRIYCMYQKA
ncbi:CDP-alcohol phosphatidyltransferase family protein [Persephonella sp. KM09-Lau-8]|uniref:CDP-alcohol phosphatidyltransferase family protein n=1 Tax=Persephonella sp. KM09-Lau-8 TaxID=1158345 RepID=UPI000494F6B4|nr:CDP-alcohol phosphatidyltransferase family protein [Persephonella sp. KM09-Lau-8]